MTTKIVNVIDGHVHLREANMLRLVTPYTAKYFKAAVVMPNLTEPVNSIDRVEKYRQEICYITGKNFQPLMTMYFNKWYTLSYLSLCKDLIVSIKMYPKGITTNSEHGVDLVNDIVGINEVLGYMEELDIPLSVHAEAPGYHQDREMLCIQYINQWLMDFPKLKIIIEHVGDRRVLSLLDLDGVYATITPHHLLLTGDDYVGPPLNVHNYCLPVCKRPEDRRALFDAVTGDYKDKVMLGTDSAAHTKHNKHMCGCAGIFNSPIALLIIAEVFDNDQIIMQRFCSDNAKQLHKLDFGRQDLVVEIEHRTYKIPQSYSKILVPMWAGKSLSYNYINS